MTQTSATPLEPVHAPAPSADATASAPPRGPSALVRALSIALLCLIWGSTWLVIQHGLADLPPLLSAGVRFAVAAFALALVAAPLARLEGGVRPTFALVLTAGGLNFAVSYGVVYTVETVLPSGLVSVLYGTFPLMMAVAGHLWIPGERLGARQGLGFLAGFLGVAFLYATDLKGLGPGSLAAGLLLLVGPFASTIGQTILKRKGGATSAILLNRDAMAVGAALLLAAAFVFERGRPAVWSPAAIAGVLYLAIIGTVVTFSLYFWLLRYSPSGQLSLISYVTPVLALGLGVAFGTDRVLPTTLAGAGLIVLGIVLVTLRPSSGPRARPPRAR